MDFGHMGTICFRQKVKKMPHGVESLKLWRVENENHGFLCQVSLITILFCFVLFCFFGTNGQIHGRKEPVFDLTLVNLSNCSYICSKFVLNCIKDGLDYFSISY